MGGNIWKTRRLSRIEYVAMKAWLVELLPEMHVLPVQEAVKPDYGDIDFYHQADPALHDLIVQRLTPLRLVTNGPTLSVEYEGIQVDFHSAKHPLCCAFFYRCGWSIVLCPFLRGQPIALKEDGLWTRDNFLLSNNPKQILSYLGIEEVSYEAMRTEEEVLAVFCTSWIYDPELLFTFPSKLLVRSLMRKLYLTVPGRPAASPPVESAIDWFGQRDAYDAFREQYRQSHSDKRLILDFLKEESSGALKK